MTSVRWLFCDVSICLYKDIFFELFIPSELYIGTRPNRNSTKTIKACIAPKKRSWSLFSWPSSPFWNRICLPKVDPRELGSIFTLGSGPFFGRANF